VAVLAAQALANGPMREIETLRDALVAVGEGRRDVHVEVNGDDELADLARATDMMVERLRSEEGARRDLIAAGSHDLRTPITSLQLRAEAIGDDVVDETTRREYLDRMTTHIRALSALIDDLFELSKLEAGDIRWSVERVELGELVGETVAAMRAQADAKGVDV